MAAATPSNQPLPQVAWLTDLIRLEILLWDRVDRPLRETHDLPLAHFEALNAVAGAGGSLRVGDVATSLRITVGGASKLIDRLDRTGLIRREPDPTDRRASRATLTEAGRIRLAEASHTYAATVSTILDPALSAPDQANFHAVVRTLLTALTPPDRPAS